MKDIKERSSYKAYHKFNNEALYNAMSHMEENFGADWLHKDPASLNMNLTDYQNAATVFSVGYDKISVTDSSIRPMIEDYHESYEIKRKWIDHMNQWILDMFEKYGHDSEVFLELYTMFDKDRWGGMEQYKILSLGSEKGNLVMSALKNFCWFRHMEGRTITLKTAKILESIFHNSIYWTFDDRCKVIYDDNLSTQEIYSYLKNDTVIASNFVRAMIYCKQPQAYKVIEDEVVERFPEEKP